MDASIQFLYNPRMLVAPLQIRSYNHVPEADFTTFASSVLRAGHVRTAAGSSIKRRSYPGVDILFCRFGRGFVLVEEREFAVEQGEIAWIPNVRPHGHRPDPTAPWELLWLRADGPGCARMLAARFGENEHVQRVADRARIEDWFNDLFAVMDHPGDDADWRLNQLVGRLLLLLSPAITGRRGDVPEAVTKAIAAMSSRLADPWAEADLVQVTGVSGAHLRRLFARHAGTSPRRWLIDARIRSVQKLLGETHLPIASIALETGFSDVFHLGREFKRVTGQSPARWRRNEKLI